MDAPRVTDDPILTGHALLRPAERVIQASGEDARSWLNGQLTQDVSALAPNQASYSLVVSVKGKILSDLWVVACEASRFLLLAPANQAALLVAHFDKHLIMEDVELEELSDVAIISGCGAPPAAARKWAVEHAGHIASTRRFGTEGWDLIGNAEELSKLAAQLAKEGIPEASPGTVKLSKLRQGIPSFGIDFDHHHYPQEAGVKSAVSFTKGCYIGQEVVCMLENRGRLKRKLVQLSGKPGLQLQQGDELCLEGEPVGTVTSSAGDVNGVWAFAYIKASAFAVDAVQIGNDSLQVRETGA